MFIIILSLTGIVAVISIWLYGSYKDRLETSVSEVERSLFNVVQNYYNFHQDSIKQHHKGDFHSFDSGDLVKELSKVYSGIDSSKLKVILDSLSMERFTHFNSKMEKPYYNNVSKSIMPPFLLEQISFDTSTLVTLDSLLSNVLKDKGMGFDVRIVLERMHDNQKRYRPRAYVDSLGFMSTRPMLVNPAKREFLKATFVQPVSYVLSKMFWQLVVAFLLVFGLIGTFSYLFWTISRQNKLAILRKSFVNNMTHELKTPVATVMAAIEAVQRYGAKDDKTKMEKYLQISQSELTHLANMIEKVLQLDMDEVKGIVLLKVPIDIKLLVLEVIELSKLGANKEVHVNLLVDDDDFWLNADASHLKNVFNNLLDNAIKYSYDSAKVDVHIYKAKKDITIEIKDYGIGIAQNYIDNIFTMFFRVPSGDLHPVKGFGLGLAYVKQVVEQHGGTVAVNSELNKGTTFIVKLPL